MNDEERMVERYQVEDLKESRELPEPKIRTTSERDHEADLKQYLQTIGITVNESENKEETARLNRKLRDTNRLYDDKVILPKDLNFKDFLQRSSYKIERESNRYEVKKNQTILMQKKGQKERKSVTRISKNISIMNQRQKKMNRKKSARKLISSNFNILTVRKQIKLDKGAADNKEGTQQIPLKKKQRKKKKNKKRTKKKDKKTLNLLNKKLNKIFNLSKQKLREKSQSKMNKFLKNLQKNKPDQFIQASVMKKIKVPSQKIPLMIPQNNQPTIINNNTTTTYNYPYKAPVNNNTFNYRPLSRPMSTHNYMKTSGYKPKIDYQPQKNYTNPQHYQSNQIFRSNYNSTSSSKMNLNPTMRSSNFVDCYNNDFLEDHLKKKYKQRADLNQKSIYNPRNVYERESMISRGTKTIIGSYKVAYRDDIHTFNQKMSKNLHLYEQPIKNITQPSYTSIRQSKPAPNYSPLKKTSIQNYYPPRIPAPKKERISSVWVNSNFDPYRSTESLTRKVPAQNQQPRKENPYNYYSTHR